MKKIGVLPGIKIRGFMTSAPFVENPEDNRKYFRELKQLLVDINNKNIDNVYMNVLSMGMTNDYTVAVEEGATHGQGLEQDIWEPGTIHINMFWGY